MSGVEISNSARVFEYLRLGLGGTSEGRWEIGPAGKVCSVLYRPAGAPLVYVSPTADPAPWYDSAEPGSATFLGLALLDIQGYDATLTRAVSPRLNGLGGGTFSGERRNPRAWKFRGALISADDAGAEYGLRWLEETLRAPSCNTCLTGNLTVMLVCPPDNGSNDQLGRWTSYEVALTDGPHEIEPWGPARLRADTDVLSGCRDWVTVEFTLTAGNPFLYKARTTLVNTTAIGLAGAACSEQAALPGGLYPAATYPAGESALASGAIVYACGNVTAPKRGTLGGVFTLVAPAAGMGPVRLAAHASCAAGAPVGPPVIALDLAGVPPSATVVVDCSLRTVTVTVGGVTTDGQYLLNVPVASGIPWVELRDCDTGIGCFCAYAQNACAGGTGTTVKIETQLRQG